MTDTVDPARPSRPGSDAPQVRQRPSLVLVDGHPGARRLGLAGALLMAVGALGAGALPVPNPLFGLRLLGLPARNATLAMAITYVGMALLVLAWIQIARSLLNTQPTDGAPDFRQSAVRTALTWALPLSVAPLLFSRDVYSYLAQGEMLGRGLDPYLIGPAVGLGSEDPLVRSIPSLWRDTPAPYGPLFLLIGRGVTAISGENVVAGVVAYRLVALLGLIAVCWALRRLAERAGVGVAAALWCGAAHPLVLFHLVSGAHSEAVMIGFLLVGLEVGLRGGTRIVDPRLLAATVLIACAAAVKLPALLALGFLGMELVRRRGGRFPDLLAVAGTTAIVAAGVFAGVTAATGAGWGWLGVLSAPSLMLEWISPSTVAGLAVAWLGVLAGFGDHTAATLAVARVACLTAGAIVCGKLLWSTLRDRIDPLTGVAAGMAVVALTGPSLQPWYLLWALVPLAATAAAGRYRMAVWVGSALLALVILPAGAATDLPAYQLVMAIGGAVALLALVWWSLSPGARAAPRRATGRHASRPGRPRP